MIIIKATKDTLKDLNVQPEAADEPNDLFYAWHVNFFTLYGKKYYVFMNDLSRLSLTVSGIRKNQAHKLREIFLSHLQEYLSREEISNQMIKQYVAYGERINITKTDSRSVLSTLTEIMLVMKSLEQDRKGFEDEWERNKWNNRFIYKPIGYNQPIDVFVQELNKRSHASLS